MSSDERHESDSLESLIARYLEAEKDGRMPDRDSLLQEHPDLADSLREFFENHDRLRTAADAHRATVQLPATEFGTNTSATIGDQVRYFGDYELLEKIARGGMGVVFKARQVNLNRIVALKMILAGQLAGEEELQRFYTEAEAAAQLDHPGIVPIIEIGEHGGQHYFSMGYVEGESLAHKVADGPLPPKEAAEMVARICDAMAYAHDHGVIHRDLKPANIILDLNGHPRLTDFGLAKKTEADSSLTGTGQILGTPAYMPPEQASGKADVGPLVDVYSLGAILYCLLTGRPPFQASSPMETLLQVLERDPLPPSALNPQVPKDLETICLKCLRKDPRQRYTSARTLAEELNRYLQGLPIHARPIGPVARFGRWCHRNPLVASLSAAVALTLLLGITVSTYFAFMARAKARSEYAARQQAEERAVRESEARQEAVQQLWNAYLAEARTLQWSHRSGQRIEALQRLKLAAAIRPSMELRNEVVASLALVDMKPTKQWAGFPQDSESVAFDASLTRYAAGDMSGNVVVRRIEDGQELIRLPGFGSRTDWRILRFSHGGNLLAVGYPNAEVRIWDLQSKEIALTIPYPHFEATFDFSPDDRRVAFCEKNGRLHFFDLLDGVEADSLDTQMTAFHLKFSPDGERIAVCGNQGSGCIRVFDVATGMLLQNFVLPGEGFRLAWHPKSRLLAANCPPIGLRLWDTETGELLQSFPISSISDTVVFHPKGDVLLSGGWDGYTRVWDPHTGSQLLAISGSPRHFNSEGSRIAGLAGGDQLVIWEFAHDEECRRLPAHKSHGATVHPEGSAFAAFGMNGLTFFDLESGEELGEFNTGDTYSVLFSVAQGNVITGGGDGLLQWPLSRIEKRSSPRWELGPKAVLWEDNRIRESALSADGHRLAVASVRGFGRVIDLSREEILGQQQQSGMHNVAFSQDGQVVITGAWRANSGTRVWNAESGELLHHFQHAFPCSMPRISPDGRVLAIGSDTEYQFYEMHTWRPLHSIQRGQRLNTCNPVCFSPDGRLIALNYSREEVRLYDASSYELLAAIVNRQQTVHSFCQESRRLIVTELDGGLQRLRIWDLDLVRKRLSEMGLDWADQPDS